MATLGSISKSAAVSAEATAISARVGASGLMLIAQSPKIYFSLSSRPRTIIKAPETDFTPGFVLMI